jgi:peptidoglycan/LPS O-acetylase OafA/YrhL
MLAPARRVLIRHAAAHTLPRQNILGYRCDDYHLQFSARSRAMTGVAPAPTQHRALGYQPALDGLRAVAVAGVLLYHVGETTYSGSTNPPMKGGFLGVSSFLTLSGFLITTILLGELRATQTVDVAAFWSRRVKRLAPGALLVVALSILLTRTSLAGWGSGMLASDGIAGAWNVVNWHVMTIPIDDYRALGALGPYWSLGVEEQFYLAMAGLFIVLRRWPATISRNLGSVAAVVWVGSLAIALVLTADHPREMFGTDVRAAELAAGVLLAVWLQGRALPLRISPQADQLVRVAGWVGLAVTVTLFFVAQLDQSWVRNGGFAALSLVHVAVILGALSHGSMARMLSWRPLVALGKISYSLYLVHWPIVISLRGDRLGASGVWLAVIRILGSVVGALILYFGVEKPLRRYWRSTPWVTIAIWLTASVAVTILALVVLK